MPGLRVPYAANRTVAGEGFAGRTGRGEESGDPAPFAAVSQVSLREGPPESVAGSAPNFFLFLPLAGGVPGDRAAGAPHDGETAAAAAELARESKLFPLVSHRPPSVLVVCAVAS